MLRSVAKLPCSRCLHDVAFASGMAGGARCPLIERATTEATMQPEWRYVGEGAWACKSFESVAASAEVEGGTDNSAIDAIAANSAH